MDRSRPRGARWLHGLRELVRLMKQISEGRRKARRGGTESIRYRQDRQDIVNISSYAGEKLDRNMSILTTLLSRLPGDTWTRGS